VNEYLLELVEGKRVAIIGPAPHLENLGDGPWIDEHDIIIRPNQFYIPDKLKKDYGSRTDIMFHNFGTIWMNGLKDNIIKYTEQFNSLRMLVCPLIYGTRGKEDNYMSWSENHIGDVVSNADRVRGGIPFYWVGVKKYKNWIKEIGCEPYTGFLTILTILEYPIKELYVSGFDFYMSNKVYFDGFANPIDGPVPSTGGEHGDGCSQRQIFTFKNLLKKYEILKVDDKLKELILDN